MKPKRFKPRFPQEARDRLHKGGAQRDKKKYSRKRKHKASWKCLYTSTVF